VRRPSLAAASVSSSGSDEENLERDRTSQECIGCEDDNNFLRQTGENRDLNQYWYSKNTIEILCNAITEGLSISNGSRVAFLSTPSLFFSLSSKERENCALFDFDTSWESYSGYQFYDYNDPTNVNESCQGAFDLIVIDPPFISGSVWENYAITAKLLMKGGRAQVIATTVEENAILMKEMFGCKPATFRPSIPNLVYQYSVFTNFSCLALSDKNSELAV